MRRNTKVVGGRTRPARTVVAALVPLLLSFAAPAHAHGGRVALEQWGGFPTGSALCQRRFASAMAMCAARSWDIRVDCDGTVLSGGTCDEAAAKTAKETVVREALNQVDFCSDRQLGDLGFLGLFDADQDLNDFCRRWQRMAESAVYDAALAGGAGAAPTRPAQNACVEATARAVTTLMRYTFRLRQRAMDRIATVQMPLSEKTALIARASALIARATQKVSQDLRGQCSEPDFSALYGRDAATFLQGLTGRADCIGIQAYVQDGVPCPEPVCGNGIQELPSSLFPTFPGEVCDDGNQTDGDGCDSNCTLTACGNGITTAGEECDDGNAVNGDGCSNTCTLEP